MDWFVFTLPAGVLAAAMDIGNYCGMHQIKIHADLSIVNTGHFSANNLS